jgi:hypothetical protein
MSARRRRPYNFTHAVVESGFAITAFGCGLYDAPLWLTGLAAAGMLAYWTLTRRAVLNRLRGATWITVSAVGTIAIIAIMAGAYWVGLAAGGLI